MEILSAENQKGVNAVQHHSVENQKGRYRHRLCIALVPFWFFNNGTSLNFLIMPFCLSTDDMFCPGAQLK